jgi:hypothetical protein
MQSLTRVAWLARIEQVSAGLGIDPDDPDTWRHALVRAWTLLPLAPVTVQGTYGTLPEADIVAAGDAAYAVGGVAPGPLDLSGCGSDAERLTGLGGWLRAAERKVAEVDTGRPVRDPNDDWHHEVDGEGFFLVPVPRSAWRSAYLPGALPRPYTRRALLRFRIMPEVIRGLPVHFTVHPRVGLDGAAMSFGASLFADFDVLPVDEADERHFLARDAVGPTAEAVRADIVEAARSGCFAHVFPELTLTPEKREVVPATLAEAAWNDAGEAVPGPDLVVAGTWHERYGEVTWNEAVVYDGSGKELLRFRKLFPYRDEKGRHERIELGEVLEVLVTRRGLYGFGVCLDFCQKATPVLTELDVDWMIVPSCGDWRTMRDHLSAAHQLQVSFDTRSFVVQQVYPKREDGGLGFVLAAPERVVERTEAELIVSQSFSIYPVLA